MEGELTHVLEGHTRDILCLDVQKEAAFSGTQMAMIMMIMMIKIITIIMMSMVLVLS